MTDSHPRSGENEQQYRIEHDTMGEVRVPVHALYGAQTQRAVENFPISGKGLEPRRSPPSPASRRPRRWPTRARGAGRRRSPTRSPQAADEVAAGKHDGEFPIDVYQTGSGTSSNMNMNEVLATLATRAARRDRCTRTTT